MNKKHSKFLKNKSLMISAVAIIIFTILALWWAFSISWQTLLPENFSEENKRNAISKLMEWRVNYKIDPETGVVEVPNEIIPALRHRLEEFGITQDVESGLDLITESDYGMSEFSQQINYQRGLEGEIANTIRSISNIKHARVHLTLAKKSLFKQDSHEAKASVVVTLQKDQYLEKKQVKSIQSLVAASVADLLIDNVIVLDNSGNNLLSEYEESSTEHVSGINDRLEQKIYNLVYGMVGNIDVHVAVSTIINLDKKKSIKEHIIPTENGVDGYITKKHIKNDSTSKPNNALEVTSETTSDTIEEEYLYSRERAEIEYASGQVNQINIGIVIGRSMTPEMINNISEVVSSGLGLSINRGDSIKIVSAIQVNNNSEFNSPPVKTVMIEPLLIEEPSTNEKPTFLDDMSKFKNIEVITIFIFLVLTLVFISIRYWILINSKSDVIELTKAEKDNLLKDINAWVNPPIVNVKNKEVVSDS